MKKTYDQRWMDARYTQQGDNWRHLKTGKTCIVTARVGSWSLALLHESGKKTTKQEHYLAAEYEKIEQP
jgi:hypothetical protein